MISRWQIREDGDVDELSFVRMYVPVVETRPNPLDPTVGPVAAQEWGPAALTDSTQNMPSGDDT